MNERRGAFPSGLQFTLRNKQLSFTNVNMSAHSDMRKTSGSDLELQHRSRKVVRKHFKPRLTSDDCVINAEAWPGGGQRAQQNSYKSIAEMLQTEEVMTHRQTFREMWETEYVPEDPGGAEQSCCSSTLEGARGGCSESSMWTPPCTLHLLIRKTPGRRCDASSPWTHAQDAASNQP